MLTINIDREKATRYGLNIGDIQDTVATAIGAMKPARSSRVIAALTSW